MKRALLIPPVRISATYLFEKQPQFAGAMLTHHSVFLLKRVRAVSVTFSAYSGSLM
jgi:hypothetical protein